jgi:hypothetical protein
MDNSIIEVYQVDAVGIDGGLSPTVTVTDTAVFGSTDAGLFPDLGGAIDQGPTNSVDSAVGSGGLGGGGDFLVAY